LHEQVTPFRVLYFSVALYTLRHSAIGFATIEQREGVDLWAWLAALILDIGMLLAAERLRTTRSNWLILGLALSALGSAYTQLLFGVTNAKSVVIAPGATWATTFATWIIEKRVVILPVLMPVLVVVYAFASKARAIISVGNEEGEEYTWVYIKKETPALSDGNEETPMLPEETPVLSNGHSKKKLVQTLRNMHPTWTHKQLAEKAGCSVGTVSKAVKEME